jgi:hypothetical protein
VKKVNRTFGQESKEETEKGKLRKVKVKKSRNEEISWKVMWSWVQNN